MTAQEQSGGGLTLGFVARATLVVLGLWGLAHALWLGRDLLFVAFFAALTSLFLSIFVDRLEAVGVPRGLAAPVVLLAFLGAIAAVFFLTWPTLQGQFEEIRRQLPGALDRVGDWVQAQYRGATGEFGRPWEELEVQIRGRLGRELAATISGAIPLLNTLVGALAAGLVVLFAGLYLAIEPGLYVRGAQLLVPRSRREGMGAAVRAVGRTMRRWMVGTAIDMAVIGVVTTVGLLLLGVPAAVGLGVLAGLLEFVPIFGPILSAVPAIAVALILSPAKALWVIVLYIVIQQLEGNLLHPLVMKGAVELPPALTILFQALMALLFGFLGLLLAVPILAATMVLVEQLYVHGVTDRS